jgi:hypothetical protein
MILHKTRVLAIAILAMCSLMIPGVLTAAAPDITYAATGTFAAPPISGDDTLRLAGEPFSVSIVVSASTVPYKTGPNWAGYHQLKLTGTVHSGLVGPTPVSIASGEASIIQALDPEQFDQFTMEAPIKVVGISLTIKAQIQMPWGTITNQLLHPFSPVTLATTNTSFTYSDGTSTSVLAISTGTLTATIPTGSTTKRISGIPHFSFQEPLAIISRRSVLLG